MDDDRSHRWPVVVSGVAVEAGLAVVALGFGWLVGISPVRGLRWDANVAITGVLATGPLLLMFAWSLRSKLPFMVRIRAFFDEVVRPLFGPCSILDFALVSIAAGVGEELLFRGLIQAAAVRGLGLGLGLTIASLVFGLLHPITPAYVVLAAVMGGYLGLLWVLTDNLLSAIVAHSLYDFLALVYLMRAPISKRLAPSPRRDGGPGERSSKEILPE
jgi:CAAX protease family protein